jgi:hypothetical protein
MSKKADKEQYLKDYPGVRKWVNECMVCHTVGYKPELPEKIYPGYMAENIRKYFSPLKVNDISICDDCSRHWINSKDL